MSGAGKLVSLLSLLRSSPREFLDRVAMLMDVRLEALRPRGPTPAAEELADALARLDTASGLHISRFMEELALKLFAEAMRLRIAGLDPSTDIPAAYNADPVLARFCYAVCRALEPAVVVETGVAHGVTSAFILEALDLNGRGTLHSVDLPPLGRDVDRMVGGLIPHELKKRWRLHRGVSERLLPTLLRELGSVDLFVHDSLHTYRNIRRELDIVTPSLARPSVVIADDAGGNAAFARWSASVDAAFRGVLREEGKDAVFGVVLLR